MKKWWSRRSLKLRLTVWYAAAAAFILLALAVFAYEVMEHRLGNELDRQLRIDFDLVEAQLDLDATGAIRWQVKGAHGDEGFARLSAWFEVWSEDKKLLLRHWPVPESEIKQPLPPPTEQALRFETVELENELYVRVIERPARVGNRGVMIRVLRDEMEMRRTLQELLEVVFLGFPLAVLLSSIGGYLIAGRSLSPVGAMAEQARQITAESLSQRLPVPNSFDELGQLATVFNHTLERLENSFMELKRFTADASHELRTPLTALRAVGEVALREAHDPATLREVIGSMLEEAGRLNDLAEAMLTLARVESGEEPARSLPLCLNELLSEVKETLEVLAMDKQQLIQVIQPEKVMAKSDRVLLKQALMNILHNAIRYSPSQSQIRLRCLRQDALAIIEIEDQGEGIAPEHQAKVFTRFYRIDEARSRAEGGTGLGLAIAKRSVERQGGRLELESRVGKGSLFRVILPAL